ncbi:hypothetical protein CQA65_29905 [Klebsiella pneumoniae]|nr:hypothetical protein CQA65_29905 [Klebsiella pneumoniae]
MELWREKYHSETIQRAVDNIDKLEDQFRIAGPVARQKNIWVVMNLTPSKSSWIWKKNIDVEISGSPTWIWKSPLWKWKLTV